MAGNKNIGYEKKDVNVRFVIGISLVSIIVFVLILILLSDYFIATQSEITYETQLQPVSVMLDEILGEEEEILTTYKVLDAEKGVYRIPIERAIKLLSEN